jgi:tetratricopeptide (TPR) repeat protein
MIKRMRVGACLLAAAIMGACASHRPQTVRESLVHRGADDGVVKKAANQGDPAAPLPADTLESFIEKVRQLSAVARPPRPNDAATLEHSDPELTAARARLTFAPTAENHRRVAEAYARHGVLDAAYNHFAAALRLAPRDATSLDGRARIWRNWGLPHLGLSDAYRAIAIAPASAVPLNTLGTLLLNMGRLADARAAFERTLVLDPRAAYALNNLCYTVLLQGDNAHAIESCRAALREQPDLTAARNNLALAYGASGDWPAATKEFALGGGAAAARYNMGVALSATRHFDDAARAFDEASVLLPSLTMARNRATQARRLAARAASEGADDQPR